MCLRFLQIECQLAILVKDDALVPAGVRITPAKRTKDDRIFETFALVDRHDANGLFIAFQPLLVLFRARDIRILYLLGETFEGAGYSEPVFHTHRVQELGELKYIGQTPFAGWITKQTLADPLL